MNRKIKIINGLIFQEHTDFIPDTVYIVDDKITGEAAYHLDPSAEEVIDAAGKYVIPGLTDIHFHGAIGSDCCDGTFEAFQKIADYELENGIMQITPATMTVSVDTLKEICKTVRNYFYPEGADLLGLYMEGPFINPSRKGAQNEAYIKAPDSELLQELQILSGNKILSVIVAPEIEGAMDFISGNKNSINISLGHMNADYDTARQAIACGASELTHTFNAMPPLSHRAPGPIGAAAETEHCMAELICDGVHIHPASVRAAFKLFGDERIIMISDSMRAAGMPDGVYDLGGQEVHVNGKLAVLKDGTLAGSVTNLMNCVRTAVREMQIPLHSAVRCAALNPARAVGMEDTYGSLRAGKTANIVLLDQELRISGMLHHGKPVTKKSAF